MPLNVDYGLVNPANLPKLDPMINLNMAAKQQEISSAQTAEAGQQLQQSLAKASAVNDMVGSVLNLPPEMRPQAYLQQLQRAKQMGLNVEGAPEQYNENYVTALGMQSEKALKYLSAQYEMRFKNAELQNNTLKAQSDAANANIKAQAQGLPPPFPNAGMPPQGPLGSLLNRTSPTPAATPLAQATEQTPINPTPADNSTTSISPGPSQLMVPAEKQAQEAKAKNWEETLNALSKATSSYNPVNNVIDHMRTAVSNRGKAVEYGSVLAKAAGQNEINSLSETNQMIQKDADYLMQQYVKTLTASGISRLDIPIVKAVQNSLPEPGKFNSVNQEMLDKIKAANEVTGKIAPRVFQVLDKTGMRDPLAAQNFINTIVEKTGAYSDKTGNIDLDKLQSWPKYVTPAVLNESLGTSAQTPHSNLQSPPTSDYVAAKTGQHYTQEDILHTAKQFNLTPEQVIQKAGLHIALPKDHREDKPTDMPVTPKTVNKPSAQLGTPESLITVANSVHPNNKILAQVAASQAMLESGYPNNPSALATKYNNAFGIKGTGTAGTVNLPTQENINGQSVGTNANFARNQSLSDSFKQHAELLNKPIYSAVKNASTFQQAAEALQKAGYATDPNYAKKLVAIRKRYFANND